MSLAVEILSELQRRGLKARAEGDALKLRPAEAFIDIGTLADLGPLYSGYNYSLAAGSNRAGTLIVGWSSTEFDGPESLPVIWTPNVVWTSGQPTTTWKIHKLDMGHLNLVS